MSLSPVNAMALPGAAGAHPLRLKGGAVERCTSAEDAAGGGKIVESAEMAGIPSLFSCNCKGVFPVVRVLILFLFPILFLLLFLFR
jgi:hypothetical protein